MHTFNDAPDFFNSRFIDENRRNLAEKSKETLDFIQSFSEKEFFFILEEEKLIFKFKDDSDYFILININNLRNITDMINFKNHYTFKTMKIVQIYGNEGREDFDVVVNILYKKENIYLLIELRNQ